MKLTRHIKYWSLNQFNKTIYIGTFDECKLKLINDFKFKETEITYGINQMRVNLSTCLEFGDINGVFLFVHDLNQLNVA